VFIPLDFLRAASGCVSPFYVQWFDMFVPKYGFTSTKFQKVKGQQCTGVTVQVFMSDVHSALMSTLALNYRPNERFIRKFYLPGAGAKWPLAESRMIALRELSNRFIFDFIIGNTDRGMNDHNNFVYGGCLARGTGCSPPKEPWKRTKYPALYAFLDHGSSFHSHRFPPDNPLTSNATIMCRYERSTIDSMRRYVSRDRLHKEHPLVDAVRGRIPAGAKFFGVVSISCFKASQKRLERVVEIVDDCVKSFGEAAVYAF
jgi:hypothetical protein